MVIKKSNINEDMKNYLDRLKETSGFEPLDYVLISFYAMNGKVPSRIHLQKFLFIASQHKKALGDILRFEPYRKGAWSEEVHDALENAVLNNYVVEKNKELVLTEKGFTKANDLWNSLNEDEKRFFKELGEMVSKMDVDELLLYAYVIYGYSSESDVYERLPRGGWR